MPHRLRVLVVDDNPDTAEALAAYLNGTGSVAVAVTSGEEAIKSAAELKPACVLLDIRMPGMNGVEVAQHFRREYGGTVTLIGLTGGDAEAHDFQLMLALCEHVLQKPVDLARLQRLIQA